jgi:gamma-glutamylcyclotransferase (GGCT)/AIG2-like uncharacterized protein YtfP
MTINQQQLKVFVYGTLKPNGKYYPIYCQGKTIKEQKCTALGKLFALPCGYPAMVMGNEQIWGFLLIFADVKELANLDKLEGYSGYDNASNNEYERREILVYDENNLPLDTAWVYFMSKEKVNALKGNYLVNGYWQEN